jgi:Zn-dependent protease with chaperone function
MRSIFLTRNRNSVGKTAIISVLLMCALPIAAFSQRTKFKPGWNVFSPQEEVELGRQVAQDAERKLPMLRDARVDNYLDRLGKKLSEKAPGERYPYQFKCVNDSEINAFALPGGFLFVNRGTIEAADNEAELAGVISHEISHAALRHGTHQASKAQIAQGGMSILGIFLGGKSSAASLAAQIGGNFTASSILLKYSRDDERQADLLGSQILYDNNYDPTYMAKFFEKLGTEKRGSDFFSSHPNPQNRIQNINAEIGKMGALSGSYSNDTADFREIRRYVKSLPPAPKASSQQQQQSQQSQQTSSERSASAGRPQLPSTRLVNYNAGNISLSYPDNWKIYGREQAYSLAPDGGIVSDGKTSALAYGVVMEVAALRSDNSARPNLQDATDQLIDSLQNSNRNMRIRKDEGQIRVGGKQALSIILTNDSPLGGREINRLVTVLRPEGLVYFIFVAPEQEYSNYQKAFKNVIDSVRFYDR